MFSFSANHKSETKPDRGNQAGWLSRRVWWGLRLGVLSGVIWAFFYREDPFSFAAFWALFFPFLLFVIVLVPGVWREVCPLAFANQLPRAFGLTFKLKLPASLQKVHFLISFSLFVGALFVFHQSFFTDILYFQLALGGLALLAFLGGLLIEGKAGWCGTFCPLSGVERLFGSSPLITTKNAWCYPCLDCQKNCMDFNPRPALSADLADADEKYALVRLAASAFLLGLAYNYFRDPFFYRLEAFTDLPAVFLAPVLSVGLVVILYFFLPVSAYHLLLLSLALTLAGYYYVEFPSVASFLRSQSALQDAAWFGWFFAADPLPIFFLALALLLLSFTVIGLGQHAFFQRKMLEEAPLKVSNLYSILRSVPDAPGGKEGLEVLTQTPFPLLERLSVYDNMLRGGIQMPTGCHQGYCGACAVSVIRHANNLTPPTEIETETLEWMNARGRARLGCQCFATGPIRVNKRLGVRYALSVDMPQSTGLEKRVARKNLLKTSRSQLRVVVLGHGPAAVSFLSTLRLLDGTCVLTHLPTVETPLYNSFGLREVLERGTRGRNLHICDERWYERFKVSLLHRRFPAKIDLKRRALHFSDTADVSYDRLVLSFVSKATLPPIVAKRGLQGILVYDGLASAQRLETALKSQKIRSIAILGGKPKGVELADILSRQGYVVTLLHEGPHLCDGLLDEPSAKLLGAYLVQQGVRLCFNETPKRFLGNTLLEAVETHGQIRVVANLAIVVAESQPDIKLARQAGVASNGNRLIINGKTETNIEGVYAIGSCAYSPGLTGSNWHVANRMGKIAAANLVGLAVELQESDKLAPTVLRLRGADFFAVGPVNDKPTGRTLTRESVRDDKWWRVQVDDHGHLLSAVAYNFPEIRDLLTRALQAGSNLRPLVQEFET